MTTVGAWWMWGAFFALICIMMLVDIVVLHGGRAHRVSLKESTFWVLIWMGMALLFDFALWRYLSGSVGPEIAKLRSLEFLTGYLIEWSLSVDNLFVFLLIFNYFAVPPELQRRTLLFGIFGAIFMRLLFITAGVWLVVKFHWILYLFGIFLIYSGIKILLHDDSEPDLASNPILLWMKKHLRTTHEFHGEQFFIKLNNVLYVTPLFVILILIEVSDIIFAVDSIPAIFAITEDPFIIYTSNIFAILGLRAMYFMLARMHEVFEYLKHGVGVILTFVGCKMLIAYWYKIPTVWALLFIVITLGTCIGLSLLKQKKS